MVLPTIQIKNFMSVVTGGEWWGVKKSFLVMLLEKGKINKKGRDFEIVVLGPRNEK
jgi:hypothetical protein